jgi:hypothetical protein
MDKTSYSPKMAVTTFKATWCQIPGAHITNSRPNAKHKSLILNLHNQEKQTFPSSKDGVL